MNPPEKHTHCCYHNGIYSRRCSTVEPAESTLLKRKDGGCPSQDSPLTSTKSLTNIPTIGWRTFMTSAMPVNHQFPVSNNNLYFPVFQA